MTAAPLSAAAFTDDLNRSVELPDAPHRVWVAYPPLTYFFYALAPDLLAGWNFPPAPAAERYLDDAGKRLPVIGGWFGQRQPDMEALLLARPDLALVWDRSYALQPKLRKSMEKSKIPVVALRVWEMAEYPRLFRTLGALVNRPQKGEELASYLESSLARLRHFHATPNGAPTPKVFYAIGKDGLKLDCAHQPFIRESVALAGGKAIDFCSDGNASLRINPERLLLARPDVIFVQDPAFYETVRAEPRWKQLNAVADGRVYLVPSEPYNWVIYPPSFMRVLAAHWMTACLYPDYGGRFEEEARLFFRLFFRKTPEPAFLQKVRP